MSSQKKYLLIFSLTAVAITSAAADLFSIQPPPNQNTSSNRVIPPQPVPVLTPSEFKSQVQSSAQANQEKLSREVNALLPPKTTPSAPTPVNTEEPADNMPTAFPETPAATPPPETPPPLPPPVESKPVATLPAAPIQTTTPPPPPPAASKPSSQVYTGFQNNGGSSNTNSSPSTQPSSGWNIKY